MKLEGAADTQPPPGLKKSKGEQLSRLPSVTLSLGRLPGLFPPSSHLHMSPTSTHLMSVFAAAKDYLYFNIR